MRKKLEAGDLSSKDLEQVLMFLNVIVVYYICIHMSTLNPTDKGACNSVNSKIQI